MAAHPMPKGQIAQNFIIAEIAVESAAVPVEYLGMQAGLVAVGARNGKSRNSP